MSRKDKVREEKTKGATRRDPAREDIQEMTAPPSPAMPRKAEGDETALRENRERLKVDEEHKTPAMQKGHRGTFP